MIDRTTKLRWRRQVRRSRRQVESIGEQAEQHLEQHVISRLGRLWGVRRFMIAWVLLIGALIVTLIAQTRALSQYYQTLQPTPGGTYTEGILGAFTNANPLYATGPVDSSVAHLVFSGLFKYNESNQLVGDLAESLHVNDRENVYTVKLRDAAKWQDGKPVTSADVVFTYTTIQNPDAKSPLANSWKGIKVEAVDAHTVQFTLPQALSAFPHSLTNGIVPKHWLSGVPPSQLRSIAFNTANPVGSGPFKWKTIEVTGSTLDDREERIGLSANEQYIGGKPKLDSFVVRVFHNEKTLTNAFKKRELTGAVGMNKMPEDVLKDRKNMQEYNLPLTSSTMVFFRNSNPILKDKKVRQALVQSANNVRILDTIGYPVRAVRSPLLKSQVGYDPTLLQPGFDVELAKRLLDEAGWKVNAQGKRAQNGQPLSFRFFTEDIPEYVYVSDQLQKQWQAVGVDLEILAWPMTELQTVIRDHNYDMLLYGISLGPDSDVFAYWHSSQGDILAPSRLNFSEYSSSVADRALEAGRTRSDVALRTVKYRPFLEAWRADFPALALYQPRLLYVTQGPVHGVTEHTINTSTDRYTNVQKWMVREALIDKP